MNVSLGFVLCVDCMDMTKTNVKKKKVTQLASVDEEGRVDEQ